MPKNKEYLVYVRENGFLTESGEWSNDIVDAELFTEEAGKKIANSFYADKPVLLKWC